LIVGDDEAAQGTVQIKWLISGEQTSLSQAALLSDTDGFLQQLHRDRPI
jgi:histidyl-tRNA synthetase